MQRALLFSSYLKTSQLLPNSVRLSHSSDKAKSVGIYEPSETCSLEDMQDPEKMMQNCVINVCQPGSGLLAAGYCLYSSSVIFMLSIGNGCWGFTYDSLVGEFILTHPDLKVNLSR